MRTTKVVKPISAICYEENRKSKQTVKSFPAGQVSGDVASGDT